MFLFYLFVIHVFIYMFFEEIIFICTIYFIFLNEVINFLIRLLKMCMYVYVIKSVTTNIATESLQFLILLTLFQNLVSTILIKINFAGGGIPLFSVTQLTPFLVIHLWWAITVCGINTWSNDLKKPYILKRKKIPVFFC